MTDAEINLAIAKIEYPDETITQDRRNWGTCALIRSKEIALDYADSWSDIGPIIERENIGIYPDGMSPVWLAFYEYIEVTDVSPTKAAALCYLKMKGLSDDS